MQLERLLGSPVIVIIASACFYDVGEPNADQPPSASGAGTSSGGEGGQAAQGGGAPASSSSTEGGGVPMPPPNCGDWVYQDTEGEACDDGNVADGDGCSALCTVEATCENGVLEPGELCDSGTCSRGCAAPFGACCDPITACVFSAPGTAGVLTVPSGSNIQLADFEPTCGTPNLLQVFDAGPQGGILMAHPVALGALAVRVGCHSTSLGCGGGIVTPLLPPHALVSVGFIPGSGPRDYEVRWVRGGSFLATDDGSLMSPDATWIWTGTDGGGFEAKGVGARTIVSGSFDLRGIVEPWLHIDYRFYQNGTAVGGIDYSLDEGANWEDTGVSITTHTPAVSNLIDVPLVGAADQPGVRVRLRFQGSNASDFWRVHSFFIGPRFL